jgi:hypothetical protein
LPAGDPLKLAKMLFCYDNPPGTQIISGAQDTIGIVFPGLARSYYTGAYWPARIDSVRDEATLQFVERALTLVPLGPREADFDPLAGTRITPAGAQAQAEATDACWAALLARDLAAFGASMRAAFEAQVAMFPAMRTPMVDRMIAQYRERALGWKLSGAGGGGYLVLVTDGPVEGGIGIVVRRGE